MQRYEKRYIEVDGHLVEFYYWGDHITPAIKVSVVVEESGWFFTKKRAVYSESHRMDKIHSYKHTAREVVNNYLKERNKWGE